MNNFEEFSTKFVQEVGNKEGAVLNFISLYLNEKEKKALLEKYNISTKELPIILEDDAALIGLDVKPGDIVKIERKSPTAGNAVFYRAVATR